MARLIEFKNNENELLRGILNESDSNKAIIFLSGFERTTIESKFKNITDRLRGKVNLFRFDFSGLGMSDGNFTDITVEKMSGEINSAIAALSEYSNNITDYYFIAHSLGCCAALRYLQDNKVKISGLVFLAPALNQKRLHRYWFTVSEGKKKGIEITWDNYQDYLDETAFEKYCQQPMRMTKEHYISNRYFLENMNMDYQDLMADVDSTKFLVIQSVMDDKVPYQSNDKINSFGINFLSLPEGDHDIQRPDVVERYMPKIINFIEGGYDSNNR